MTGPVNPHDWHTDYGSHLAVLLGPPIRPTRVTLTINTSWQSFLGPPIRPTCWTLTAKNYKIGWYRMARYQYRIDKYLVSFS
eukprot:SAG11_NODE_2685_length_3101_cov_1.843771_1_plen_82_part_00